MNVIFASYGNDSIALIQWAIEHSLPYVTVAYSDTGWAAPYWEERVARAELWANAAGFATARIRSDGMLAIIRRKKGWPRNGMQFCTQLLKIEPASIWLDQFDPRREATCLVGVRREESAARAAWPMWTEESVNHGGRSLWAPLVNATASERDALVGRAGFDVLPHRSMECFPCVNSSRADLRLLDEDRIAHIERIESDMGMTANGKPRTMFRPNKFMGAVGIREVARWARAERGRYEPARGCDSGMCGD